MRFMDHDAFSGLVLSPKIFMHFYRYKCDTCVHLGALNLSSLYSPRAIRALKPYQNAKRSPCFRYSQRKQPEYDISLHNPHICKPLCNLQLHYQRPEYTKRLLSLISHNNVSSLYAIKMHDTLRNPTHVQREPLKQCISLDTPDICKTSCIPIVLIRQA